MKRALFSLLILTASFAYANEDDFDGLGGNKILLEKAQALNPEVQTTVVQSRTVSRRMRFELAPEASSTFGGDTYVRTQSFGLNGYFHLTPRWALGARYKHFSNKLTNEGETMVSRAYDDYQARPRDPTAGVPQLNYPKNEMMALAHWYPIYGKINWIERSVVQFDSYVLAGAGTIELNSGSSSTYTGGLGLGLWFSPRFSTRFEMAYQRYEASYFNGPTNLDLTVASVQMGWLL